MSVAMVLDWKKFDKEKKARIEKEIGQRGNFLLIGENTAEEEVDNKAVIIIFDKETSYVSIYYHAMKKFPSFVVKAGGSYIINNGEHMISGDVPYLFYPINRKAFRIWRAYLERVTGLRVLD